MTNNSKNAETMSKSNGSPLNERVKNAAMRLWQLASNGLVVMGASVIFTGSQEEKRVERQHQRDLEQQRRNDHTFITQKHAEYTRCMHLIHCWHRQYQENAGREFKAQLESGSSQMATEINLCRSNTKDFWRLVMGLVEFHGDALKLHYGPEHHQRFVQTVKPLDVLDGYTDQTRDPVYDPKSVFGK